MGDLLLQEVARRLSTRCATPTRSPASAATSSASCSRACDAPGDATVVARQLLAHLREPFVLEGMRLEIDAVDRPRAAPAARRGQRDAAAARRHRDVLGQAVRPRPRDLRARARPPLAAPPRARRRPALGDQRAARSSSTTSPRPTCATGRIIGAEALARWDHPEFGIVGPSEFVPIAEQTGLITPLTSFVLDAAIRQVRAWKDAGLELSVAVNLSARSFLDTQLAVEIPRLLAKWGVEAELLELEITESMLMADPAARRGDARAPEPDRPDALGRRLRHGLLVAGQPQAAAGRRDQDRQVVRDGDGGRRLRRRDRALHDRPRPQPRPARRRRGRRVRGRLAHLEALGCDFAQGYYLSRPLPPPTGRLLQSAPRPRSRRPPRRTAPPPALRVVVQRPRALTRRRGARTISCKDLQILPICRH